MDLTDAEIKRYGRHLVLPEIGKQGQLRLKKAKVLLVGAGGLGSPLAMYLPAVGVGTIGLADFDQVDFSNLHRQIIYNTDDVGKSKVQSAKEKMTRLNPEVKVITHETIINAGNARSIIEDYEIVVDGTDNFPARYLINDACLLLGKPSIYGAIFRFEGQCSVFGLPEGPCYRCLFPDPPSPGEVPSCAQAGVLGILPGIIGLLQANEVIKLICQIGEPLKGRLLIFDALKTQFREVRVRRDPQCPVCGSNPRITELVDEEYSCAAQPIPGADEHIASISVDQLKQMMAQGSDSFVLLDVREPVEWEMNRIDGAVLKPLSTLQNNYQDIPKDKPVYVHCKMGPRSLKAIQFLKTKGYTNCVHVTGGIDAWEQQGLH